VINASRCRQTSCRKIGRAKKACSLPKLAKDVMAIVNCGEESASAAIEDIQAFLRFLSRADQARIVNLSSGYGELGGLSSDVPCYCLSKLTLNGATIVSDQALRSRGIAVKSVCPGWVRTDMGGPNAPTSIEDGADTAVWLATDAPHSLSGKFFRRRREISW
jgi:NAD(P)-dependent dehydrogenase (short-subunit alcohol dehydrogenase family)